MKSKTVLVTSLAAATFGLVSLVDTAGVLPFSAKTVQAEITRTENHEVKSKITPGSENKKIYVDMTVQSVPDGEYYLKFYSEDELTSKTLHIFSGISTTFTVKNEKYVNPLDSSTHKETEKPKATETPKQSTNSGQTGWSGSSYYKGGVKVVNQWIFDIQYNSYFYLNASGNFVQNAWSGNYYLKSGGYMAKSEWIYDSNYKSYYYLTAEGSYARNAWAGSYYLKSDGKMAKSEWIYDSSYQSYYYLTSEGSYARNTWVGDYYLKSNGKMAVNERTPDGYKVDGSGKWVR